MLKGELTIRTVSLNSKRKVKFLFIKYTIPFHIYYKCYNKINFLLHQVLFCHTILLHYYYNYDKTLTIRTAKYPKYSFSGMIG